MKILILVRDTIGDVVSTLHAVKQLKEECPKFEVYFHVSAEFTSLLSHVSFLSGSVVRGDNVAKHGFDAAVDLEAKLNSAALIFKSRVPLRIGNSTRWFGWMYTKRRSVRKSKALVSEAEYYWQLISLLDARLRHSRLRCHLVGDDFKELPRNSEFEAYSVLNVSPACNVNSEDLESDVVKACWSNDRWVELATLLSESNTRDIIIVLGPGSAEKLRYWEEKASKLARVTSGSFQILRVSQAF